MRPNPPLALRRGYALVAAAAIALVAASLILTRTLDLAPCPLCIFQRMLYLLLALLAAVAAVAPRSRPAAGVLAATTTLGGLATAGYQSWIQAFPPPLASCGTGNNPIEQFVYWAGEQVPWLFAAWGDCTSAEWVFLGLSMANWSALTFLAFTVALAALLLTGRPRHDYISADWRP